MSLSSLSFLRAAVCVTAAMSLFGAVTISEAEFGSRHDQVDTHDGGVMPGPITGDHLFAPVASRYEAGGTEKACLTTDDVFGGLILDVENVGGEIVLMTEGAQQEFSDAWRGVVGESRVEIALVLAHVIPDPGGDPIVDVVEIGPHGCAVSRTLLAAADWAQLIELAQSIEV